MEIKGCEKLTEANVIIVYGLPSKKPTSKTKFHDELYGRNGAGLLCRIPHRKLGRGVIEIPQRNYDEVKNVFDKYNVTTVVRLSLPETDPNIIEQITETIEDPYEKSLKLDSIKFSEFVNTKLQRIGREPLQRDDLKDELLAIDDTVEKWTQKHPNDSFASGFVFMFKGLETLSDKSPEEIKRNALRVAESIKQWTIAHQIIQESKDTDSVEEILKKYRART